jgi:hypothetical protein
MATKTGENYGGYDAEQAHEDVAAALGGLSYLDEVHTQFDTTVVPNTPTAGHSAYSLNGHRAYLSSNGTAYNAGRLSFFTTGNQVIPNGTNTAISGGGTNWSCTLNAGETYKFHGYLHISPNLGTTGTLRVNLNHSGGIASIRGVMEFNLGSGANAPTLDQGVTGGANSWLWVSGVMGTLNGNYFVKLTGTFAVTSSGTLTWQAAAPVASTQITILSYSHMDICPVTVWTG